MALPTKQIKPPRDEAVTIRVTKETYKRLEYLAKKHRLSQADIFEHLVEQEYREGRRLKGKSSRRKR